MTKAKMRENFSKINKEISKEQHEKKYLENLMDLCETYGDGQRYCSVDYNVMAIIRNCKDEAICYKALDLYRKYFEINAKFEMLIDTLTATNNFE